jgi:hypothetical protein
LAFSVYQIPYSCTSQLLYTWKLSKEFFHESKEQSTLALCSSPSKKSVSLYDDCLSTSGSCLSDFLDDNLITWCSKKQPTVAWSSIEAKYRALATSTIDLCWIHSFLRELGIILNNAWMLLCANISATYLVANPALHGRTKCIKIDYHFIREHAARDALQVIFVPSQHQIADALACMGSQQSQTHCIWRCHWGRVVRQQNPLKQLNLVKILHVITIQEISLHRSIRFV